MEKSDIQPMLKEFTYYHKLAKIREDLLTEKHLGNKLLSRDNIRLLTYNIFLRPPLINNNESDWKDERLDDFIRLLHNYDIICLQEAFEMYSSRKQKLIRAANKNGFFYYLDLQAPSFFSNYFIDGGLVILSRFPIIKHSTYYYDLGVVSDSLAQKSILYAQIEIGCSRLHLFTTHTQASYNDNLLELFISSFETRLDQINQLSSFIREVLKSEMNENLDLAILCGDLNVDALGYAKLKKNYKTNPIIIEMLESEYFKMLEVMNKNELLIENLFYKVHGYHPITYGEYNEKSGYLEQVLTHKEDIGCCQCLDYLFAVNINKNLKSNLPNIKNNTKNEFLSSNLIDFDNDLINKKLDLAKINDEEKSLFVIPNSVVVIKHLVEDLNFCKKSRVYTQLSDHYGLSCLIKYNGLKLKKNKVLIVQNYADNETNASSKNVTNRSEKSCYFNEKINFKDKSSNYSLFDSNEYKNFKEADSLIELC